MASFCRGLGPRFLLPVRQQAPCEGAAVQARLVLRVRFSSSSRFFQQTGPRPPRPSAKAPAKRGAPTSSPKPPPSPGPSLGSAAAQAAARPSTYAEQLARKGRTLLYEAPSHFWFRAGCFNSAAFCISYTVYQYWTVILYPPVNLYWWIPHAFGVILVFMAGMGTYFILGAGRIVRSIEAVPAAALATKRLAAGAGAASPIYIEVATRRPVPFLPAKKTLLRPDEVQLPFSMQSAFSMVGDSAAAAAAAGLKPVSLAERVRAERAEREARIAARKYRMDHILTAPFRDAGRAFGAAFRGIKRSFSREGFAIIRLGKQRYKLDVTGGWALDNGRAMDRLLPVRPNAMRRA